MATQAEIAAYVADLDAVATLAVADIVREFGDLTRLPPRQAAALVREFAPQIATEHAEVAAAVAADFYDELRFAALGIAAPAFTATIAPDFVPDELVEEAIGWALAPLFDDKHNPADALPRLADKTQTLVRGGARRTIARNAAGDPVGTRYARHAQPDACAFCRLLATRGTTLPDGTPLGSLYATPESATRVTGEVNDQGQQVRRPRGNQPAGEKYHTNCRCTAVPVFPGDDFEPADYVRDWQDEYRAVAAATGTTRDQFRDLLATWRELYGTR